LIVLVAMPLRHPCLLRTRHFGS